MAGCCKDWVLVSLLAFLWWSQNGCQQTKFHLPSKQEEEGRVPAVPVTYIKKVDSAWVSLPKTVLLGSLFPSSKEGWESEYSYPLKGSRHVTGYWKSVVAQDFSTLSTQILLNQVTICFEGSPVHWRRFSSIPGLYPLGTGSPFLLHL